MDLSDTSFSLYFPQNVHNPCTNVDDIKNRKLLLNGEYVSVLVIAKYVGTSVGHEGFVVWKNTLNQLTAHCHLTPLPAQCYHGSPVEGEETSEGRDIKCVPYSGLPIDSTKVQQKEWHLLPCGSLVYPMATTVNLPVKKPLPHPTQSRCQVVVLLTSDKPPAVPVHESVATLPAAVQPWISAWTEPGHITKVVSHQLQLLHPPQLSFTLQNITGTTHCFITVRSPAYKQTTVRHIHLDTTACPNPVAEQHSYENFRLEDEVSCVDVGAVHTGLPLTLRPLESYCTGVTLRLKNNFPAGSLQDVQLHARVEWSAQSEDPATDLNVVRTQYRFCKLRARRPGLMITARPLEQKTANSLQVEYCVDNCIQDLHDLSLVWNPQRALAEPKAQSDSEYRTAVERVIQSVVCHQPQIQLGPCSTGSSLSTVVDFQILDPGLYEVGQHMKVKLHYSPSSASSVAGERRGSTTSIHSMPGEIPVPKSTPNRSRKSSSMTPLGYHGNRGEGTDGLGVGSPSSLPTSVQGSPTRADRGGWAGQKSHTLGAGGLQPSRNSSYSSLLSAVRWRTAGHTHISAQDVMKRNCQVYVRAEQQKIAN